MELFKIVTCFLSFSFVYCGTGTYRAAIVDPSIVSDEHKLLSIVSNAAQLNVDILMLAGVSSVLNSVQKAEEVVSKAAKDARIYIAAQTVETGDDGESRNSFIFDRNGEIVSFRKVGISEPSAMETFTSDFGVTFGVVMEKDLLLVENMEVRNVIAFAPSINETEFLYAKQFPGSWAFTTRTNLITSTAAHGGPTEKLGDLLVAEMKSDLPDTFAVEAASSFLDLGPADQYTSELLHVSGRHVETVCHESFCCDFEIKASKGVHTLVAYNGAQSVGANSVRLQACAVMPCRAHPHCTHNQLNDNSTTVFEKLSISAFFTGDSVQYPLIISPTDAVYDDFQFQAQRNETHASIELANREIISFGIFAKDLATADLKLAEIAVENLQEVFDYVWVRLRVLIFIASIYVLEMM